MIKENEVTNCEVRFLDTAVVLKSPEFDEQEGMNRFLVSFPNTIELNEWWISKFKKPKYDLINNRWITPLKLTIRECFSSNDKNWHPYMRDYEFIENFTRFNNLKPEYVTFEALDRTGCTVYKTKYTYPVFKNIEFEEYDYSKKGLKHITVEMDFDTVEEIE